MNSSAGNSSDNRIERREGHFKGHGDLELFYQTWTTPSARATLVVTHGIAEHSECYVKTADRLCQLGWNVCAWDLRGHGRSEGKRGFVGDFHHYSLDLGYLLRFLEKSGQLAKPFAILGHSMGGLITLRHLVDESSERKSPQPAALALSSPLLGFGLAVPPAKDFAARVLNRILPSITLYNEIRYEELSRDADHVKGYATDPLRHDKISPGVYLGMIANIELVKQQAAKLTLPTVVQAAGKEKIVSLPAIRDFFPLIGASNKKLIVYDESYHEIFNDLDREQVLAELDAFLASALGLRS